jgi:hypothetical protein
MPPSRGLTVATADHYLNLAELLRDDARRLRRYGYPDHAASLNEPIKRLEALGHALHDELAKRQPTGARR